MIVYNSELEFELFNTDLVSDWLIDVIVNEGFSDGEINYVFCSDEYLLQKNIEFLNHDTLTDIISFDYTMGKLISGDIFISVERVKENSKDFNVSFNNELCRVMVHGILHYCGYKDKSEEEKSVMRERENFYLAKLDSQI
ncbi:rRNA maturation RNase YbeY [Urechidicola vernalis]|uniref:Endoribonuclease YbeY n=1 Tax=Urechidicola vernalis TaxID=3075600 RepID=A0ABU2Y762_9FLAO|nr:rRNA maturation RNase YbeY [Urechidicola sp. P050]MDT0553620.1 rRNA maturation RNase YbeY [Urechidicola sp. P050]